MSHKYIIKQFLAHWLKTVECGEETILMREQGLCVCLVEYLDEHPNLSAQEYNGVIDHFRNMLLNTLGKFVFPFGGQATYQQEGLHRTAHKNKDRIEWVKKTLKSI